MCPIHTARGRSALALVDDETVDLLFSFKSEGYEDVKEGLLGVMPIFINIELIVRSCDRGSALCETISSS